MNGVKGIVLMYHQIIPDDFSSGYVPPSLADARYGVRISVFRAQMNLLRTLGIPVISLSEFFEMGALPMAGPFVLITFDDGYESDYRLAAPVLDELGFHATFFLATDYIDRPGMLTSENAARLARHPLFSIGSHGASHRFLPELSESERVGELIRSRDRIRFLSGKDKVDLSAPGGRISHQLVQNVRQSGYRSLLTSLPGTFTVGSDPYHIPRLPILNRHGIHQFKALLNPNSLAFAMDYAVRVGKNTFRHIVPAKKVLFQGTA